MRRRQVRGAAGWLVLVLAVVAGPAAPAFACTCTNTEPARAEVVFVGRAVARTGPRDVSQRWTFDVESVELGRPGTAPVVQLDVSPLDLGDGTMVASSCGGGVEPVPGGRYRVAALHGPHEGADAQVLFAGSGCSTAGIEALDPAPPREVTDTVTARAPTTVAVPPPPPTEAAAAALAPPTTTVTDDGGGGSGVPVLVAGSAAVAALAAAGSVVAVRRRRAQEGSESQLPWNP